MRHITQPGLDLIKGYEKLRLNAYMPTADDVPTIGYGHTRGVKMGDTCTPEQAEEWLREDLADAERCVGRAVTAPITAAEFDALVSLAFNIGCGGFQRSTVLRLVNELCDDADAIRHAFGLWNKQKGKTLAGLTLRRGEEAEMFLA